MQKLAFYRKYKTFGGPNYWFSQKDSEGCFFWENIRNFGWVGFFNKV